MNLDPASPCIRHCTLDRDDMCVGCGRMLDEILIWSKASPARREEILAALPGRLATRIPWRNVGLARD